MTYQFDVDVAKEHGVDAAIMLHNLAFWLMKNKANRKNEHEGKYWTYNSARAFEELFPFWNAQKIRRLLVDLEEKGVIESGNFNTNPYDRTKWYTILDPSIFQNESLDESKMINGKVRSEQSSSITDSKPDSKPVGERTEETHDLLPQELLPSEVDPVLRYYRAELSKRLPATSWPNTSKQIIALRAIVVMTRQTQPQTPIESPERFAELVVETYERLRSQNTHAFWRRASFDPVNVERRFADVVQAIAQEYERDNEELDEFTKAAFARMAGGRV